MPDRDGESVADSFGSPHMRAPRSPALAPGMTPQGADNASY